ncbi:MAG TPA: sulfatase-like hydrolase/transferase [Bryobacteraceae bacterium]|nr:sulfatase-like hydrolase/transferase [Bryobacteraceae bacterium]
MLSAKFSVRVLCVFAALLLVSCRSTAKKPASGGEANAPLRKLNVVVVTIDTLRADRLGCYGYSKIETPVLDGLAKRGALFENAVAETPLTPPSHASIFTGQNPNVHGVRNTGGFVLQSSSTTLAEILQQQGWDTAAFIGASVLKKLFGFNQGFAVYDDEMPKPGKGQDAREYPERPAGAVVDRAIQWLNGQSGKPYFMWVHVFDPHMPYEPPAPFRQQYAGRPYDGEVAYADHELGRLFEAVQKKDNAGNTLIVVLSDHGESLGEHGEYTHGIFLYDVTLRVPFILAGPGVPGGMRVTRQARTIDVLPTILDLMGGKPPGGIQGTSLVPALAGKDVATQHAYAETLYPKMNMGWSELRAVRTLRWKFIRAPKPELYDLSQDPHETANVIDRFPTERAEMEAQLKAIAGDGKEKVDTAMVDQRTLDQLKSLGYLASFTPRQFELTGTGIDPKDRVNILRIFELAVSGESKLPPAKRMEMLKQAVAEDPTNPSVYYHLGTEYEKAGRFKDAMQLYQSATEKGIRNGRLYSRIADLYLREGNKSEAIFNYEKAAQFNPSDVESQNNLAMAYLENGRVADADRVYNWILATGEQHAPAYNGLGLIAIQRQDPATARGYFEKAVAIDPNLVEAHLNLGLIYKMMGDRARARACFETFLAKASSRQYAGIIPKVKEELVLLR